MITLQMIALQMIILQMNRLCIIWYKLINESNNINDIQITLLGGIQNGIT